MKFIRALWLIAVLPISCATAGGHFYAYRNGYGYGYAVAPSKKDPNPPLQLYYYLGYKKHLYTVELIIPDQTFTTPKVTWSCSLPCHYIQEDIRYPSSGIGPDHIHKVFDGMQDNGKYYSIPLEALLDAIHGYLKPYPTIHLKLKHLPSMNSLLNPQQPKVGPLTPFPVTTVN